MIVLEKKNWITIAKWVFSRVLLLYLFLYFTYSVSVDPVRMKGKALNHLIPKSFAYLFEVHSHPKDIDRRKMKEYERYYSQVLAYIGPQHKADIHNMLGFCYYYLNQLDKSQAFYEDALNFRALYPWSYYNLGIIHYHNRNYTQAIEALTQAVKLKISDAVKHIYHSKTYKYILLNEDDSIRESLNMRLKQRYIDSYILLIRSYQHLEKYQEMFLIAQIALNAQMDADGVFHYYQGLAAHELGDYKKSIGHFRSALNKNPKFTETYQSLNLSLKAIGQDALAKEMLNRANHLYRTIGPVLPLDEEYQVRLF